MANQTKKGLENKLVTAIQEKNEAEKQILRAKELENKVSALKKSKNS